MRTLLYTSLIAFGFTAGCSKHEREPDKVAVAPPPMPTTPPPATPVALDKERDALAHMVEERAAALDAKVDALEQRGDEKSKDAVALLRAKRDQARGKLGELGTRTQENWNVFKRDITDAWDQLERDVTEATR